MEYVGRRLTTDTRVPGRIGDPVFFDFWKNTLKAQPWHLDLVQNGYKIPLIEFPPQSFCENNKSALKEPIFAKTEIKRLEALGCIYKVSRQPHIVLPFSSVFSKKLRLVVDASRHLNPYIVDRHIKLEDLSVVETTIREGDFMCTQDLDSGYWHVPVAAEHQTLLGVHWREEDGTITFYQWRVMFLGLKDAVYVFTKILKPHISFIRGLGIRAVLYIDDQKIYGKSKEEAEANTKVAKEALRNAGWVINEKKSSTAPAQKIKFLGLGCDSTTMNFFVPEDKAVTIKEMAENLLKSTRVFVKYLARYCGKLQSCSRALGPIVRLMTRSAYRDIKEARTWFSKI